MRTVQRTKTRRVADGRRGDADSVQIGHHGFVIHRHPSDSNLQHGPVFQYVMRGNCSRACASWSAHSRGQPKARAAWPLMSAAAAPLVKWTYSPHVLPRV